MNKFVDIVIPDAIIHPILCPNAVSKSQIEN